MKTTDPYSFIHTGLIIRLLRHCDSFSIGGVLAEWKKLQRNLEEANFKVSYAGLLDLNNAMELLENDTDKSRIVTKNEAKEFYDLMMVVEKMVYAEAGTKQVYVLTENRFNLEALLSKPEKMFHDKAFPILPSIAKLDLNSGFQCLAFDQPTACAFHVLRATEAVLKEYYFLKVKRNRLETPMWGNMLDGLKLRRGHDNKLLERLKYIKDTFRNPTAHPETVYTLTEAQDLVGICIDVINRMASDFPVVT
jgi:hypothetical protein